MEEFANIRLIKCLTLCMAYFLCDGIKGANLLESGFIFMVIAKLENEKLEITGEKSYKKS